MSVRWRVTLAVLGLVATGAWAQAVQQRGFPHDVHEGLFPVCEGCHSGILAGDPGTSFPAPGQCTACHDGTRVRRVDWTGPTPRPSNLDFSHARHASAARAETDPLACGVCHGQSGANRRMAVVPAAPETCLRCHAHEAEEHLAPGRDCQACHLPLAAASRLSLDRIRDFPAPRDHEGPAFGTRHGRGAVEDEARCATCHAQESCTRCHLNGDDLAPIRGLAPDPRVAVLEAGRLPVYPTPETHRSPEWSWGHGQAAGEDLASCANCHARPSCLTCHTSDIPSIAALPTPVLEDPRGVRLNPDPRVHEAGFSIAHAPAAAGDPGVCNTCHTDGFCESCHDGAAGPAFHYPNYVQSHGAEAWGNDAECSTCHDTDVFCRSCHDALGRGSEGRLDVAYHSRRPFWLFGHGTAARQGLESCRTCHSQADCTQCHAAVGSWRINPHGPGFPADRLREANVWSCLACHRTGVPGS